MHNEVIVSVIILLVVVYLCSCVNNDIMDLRQTGYSRSARQFRTVESEYDL